MEGIKKKILVIGAMGGFGLATVSQLIKNNYYVFAADIDKDIVEKFKNNSLVSPLVMDITDPDSIERAYQYIFSETHDLDAIINMAGILIVGSVVEVEEEAVKNALDINLLGVYRVNKKFFPLLINTKGRIIIISSETARQTAAPFNGIYTLTKYALEAYSDALRRELSFLNIKVIKLQPGAFKTRMTKRVETLFSTAEKKSILFKKNLNKGKSYLPKIVQNANDPNLLAKKIVRILEVQYPRTVYSIKHDIPRTILEILPVKWTDKLIEIMLS